MYVTGAEQREGDELAVLLGGVIKNTGVASMAMSAPLSDPSAGGVLLTTRIL